MEDIRKLQKQMRDIKEEISDLKESLQFTENAMEDKVKNLGSI